jgi:hypothetical protein
MPEIEELEELLRELLAGIQELLQSGEILSDEFQGEMARTLTSLTDRIDALSAQQQQPPGQQPPSPPQNAANLNNPPSPDAQLLWILAGQNEQAFLEYLTTYPTPETQALLRNPTELQRIVQFLNEMMPPGEPLVVGGMPHTDLNSSTIWGTQYDPKSGQMKVRFQGGAEYVYQGIPPNIYKAFSQGQASAKTQGSNDYGTWWVGKNPSMGAALNQYIKAVGFPYQRIN